MRRRTELDRKLAKIIRGVRKYGAQKAILFGSCARDESDVYSDVDLIVVKHTDRRFLDRLGDVIALIEPDFALDVFVYTPAELDRMLAEGNPLITCAMKEGKVIYERPEG